MDFFKRLFNSPEVDDKVGVIRFKIRDDLWGQKTRTIQTVLAISIGAVAVGASLGASRMIAEGFRYAWLASSPSMISLQADPPVDQATLDSIKSIKGVTTVEGEMVLPTIKWRRGSDQLWAPAQLIARQDYENVQLNQMVLRSGDWPERKLMNVESGHSLQEGDQVELQIRHQSEGERSRSVGLNGTTFNVLAPPPASGGIPTFYTTRNHFTEVTGEEGFRIIRASAAEYDREAVMALTAKIQDHLKKQGYESQGAFAFGIAVTDPDEHIFNELLVSMYFLLIGMGALSLVLGLLLVFITMTALISQQIEQIGVMKAIGARRRLIFRIYLSSVLVYGGLALAVALLPGALGAYGVYAGFMSYVNYDPGRFQISWPAVTVQAAITFLAPMLAAMKPIRAGANITVREAISTYGIGGASSMLEKFMAKFKNFPELLALMLSNTFRNRQRAILIMITLIISGIIFMTVMSLGASMRYTYDDQLKLIYKFDVTFSFVDRQRIDRVESLTLDHPSVETVEMWNISNAAARSVRQAEKSINDITAMVLGVPIVRPGRA